MKSVRVCTLSRCISSLNSPLPIRSLPGSSWTAIGVSGVEAFSTQLRTKTRAWCRILVETLKKAFEATYFALLSKVVNLKWSSILMPLSACPNTYCIRPTDRTRNIGQQDGTTSFCISLGDTSNNISIICLEFDYIWCWNYLTIWLGPPSTVGCISMNSSHPTILHPACS